MRALHNTLAVLLTGALLAIMLIVAMHAVDNITARDCARGIKDACKYLPVNN